MDTIICKRNSNDSSEDQKKLDKYITKNSEEVENQDPKIRPHANQQEYLDMDLLNGPAVKEIK